MKRNASRLAFSITTLLFCISLTPTHLVGQSDGEFVTLFDGTFDDWSIENSEPGNFTINDGILGVQGSQGWLKSSSQYSDYLLRTEFRFRGQQTSNTGRS